MKSISLPRHVITWCKILPRDLNVLCEDINLQPLDLMKRGHANAIQRVQLLN